MMNPADWARPAGPLCRFPPLDRKSFSLPAGLQHIEFAVVLDNQYFFIAVSPDPGSGMQVFFKPPVERVRMMGFSM